MANKVHLIGKLIQIEMYNLKNICPFVHKISNNNFTVPLGGYCLNVENKFTDEGDTPDKFFPLTNFYITSDNKIIRNNEVNNPICMSTVYFINGYNKYVPILSHINSKYKVKPHHIIETIPDDT